MAISIINNSTAIGAQSSVNNANSSLTKTLKALSTGLRINSASDDASGLAVSEKLRGQISGLAKAATNSQDAISMLQTAEGAMGSMTSMVQRIRELAVQAGDPAYTTNDRAMLQLEVDQLKEEIDRVSSSTEFNTKKLLNGDAAAIWSASSGDIEAIIKGSPAAGDYKINYTLDPGTNSVYKSNMMTLGEGEMSYNIDQNGSSITKFDNIQGMLRGDDIVVNVRSSAVETASAVRSGGTGALANLDVATFASEASAAATGGQSYSIEIETIGKRSAGGTGTIRFRVMNTQTGELSEWVEAKVNQTGGIIGGSSSKTFQNLAGIERSVMVKSGSTTFGGGAWESGDKLLINVASAMKADPASASASIRIGADGSTLHIKDNALNSASATTHTVHTAQMDKAGNVYYGSIDVVLGKGNKVISGTATIDILGEGNVASKYTKLSQLAQFTNADGRMVLDNTQEISIYAGNGKTAKVTLEGSDTIADLENKLSSALVEQLGMGADVTNANAATINKNLVKFTGKDDKNGANAGSFTIQGAVLGKDSNLTFVGDEGVLNALGVTQVQKATDSALTVNVINQNTGEASDTITDGRLRNVIKGVDIDITPSSAADISFDETTNRMIFKAKGDPETAFLHITDNATKAAIGSNEGQTLDISIGRLDTKAMGIDNVNVATFSDAQKSLTKLDLALEQISKARATAGAQINRLEYTITNLNTTRENMIAAESRIRDLDIATASSDLAAQQVLMQSATAMLAQANQIPNYAMTLLR